MGRLTDEWGDTRASVVNRLGDWDDQEGWRLFFHAYSRMIYAVGMRSGLTEAEAHDVLQETLVCLAKQMQGLAYNPAMGSFKSWLVQQTRWRVSDQFRKRARHHAQEQSLLGSDGLPMDVLEDVEDPLAEIRLWEIWDEEWRASVRAIATTRLKGRISPMQLQIFQLVIERGWPVDRVMRSLGVSRAQVYLAKHRVGLALKREVTLLRDKLI